MELPQRVSIRYKDTSYTMSEIRLKTFQLGFRIWEEQSKPRKTELYDFILNCLKQFDRQDRFIISYLFLEFTDVIRNSSLERTMREVLIKTAFREFACALTDFENAEK